MVDMDMMDKDMYMVDMAMVDMNIVDMDFVDMDMVDMVDMVDMDNCQCDTSHNNWSIQVSSSLSSYIPRGSSTYCHF